MAETGCRTDRLEALLASETVSENPDAAADPLRHVYELAFSERADTAVEAAEEALRNAESDPALRLRLLGVLVSLHLSNQDEANAQLVYAQRLTVLAAAGRNVQHDVEAKLGLTLFREATEAELPLLLAELEARTNENAPQAVLGDLSFSAGSVHAESGAHLEATLLMQSAADYYREDGNIDGEAAALMYLAGSMVALGDEDGAVDIIDRTLHLPAARAIHASLLMLRSRTGLGTPSRQSPPSTMPFPRWRSIRRPGSGRAPSRRPPRQGRNCWSLVKRPTPPWPCALPRTRRNSTSIQPCRSSV